MTKEFDPSHIETLNYHIHPYLDAGQIRNGTYISALRELYSSLVEAGIYEELYRETYTQIKEELKLEIEYYKNYDLHKKAKDHIECLVSFEMLASYITRIIFDNIIKNHIEALARRRKQLVILDDYGLEDNSAWIDEKRYFAEKVIFPVVLEKFSTHPNEKLIEVLDYLLNSRNATLLNNACDSIDSGVGIFLARRKKPPQSFNESMSGQDYEYFVADIFNRSGCTTTLTKISGDHGADIFATKDSIKIAVQCKLYSSPVGNKSVQEIYSAKDYYDCHIACVVTSHSYTQAAKSAARKLGVRLLHHDQIEEFVRDINK
jgi:hypothetical protein